MPILIRDDDTNFFTKTNMLESIYSEAWNDGFKVSLSIVPFQKSIDDISVPPLMRNKDLHFPITDNKSLVDYLKQKIHSRKIEILQHGFSHDIGNHGRGEYGRDLDKMDDTERGRNIIRQALGVDPIFFVPPGEDISKKNLMRLIELGFVPIQRQTFFDSFLRNSFVHSHIKDVAIRAISKYKRKKIDGRWIVQLVKPVVISVGEHGISWSLTSMKSANTSSIDSLINLTNKVVESCSTSRNPVCLLNHYHIYYYDWNDSITRQDLYHAWRQILEKFNRLKFGWKVTFSELFERAKRIHNIHITKTGSKITIESETPMQDFSFRYIHELEPSNSLIFDEEVKIMTIDNLLPKKKIILYEK